MRRTDASLMLRIRSVEGVVLRLFASHSLSLPLTCSRMLLAESGATNTQIQREKESRVVCVCEVFVNFVISISSIWSFSGCASAGSAGSAASGC